MQIKGGGGSFCIRNDRSINSRWRISNGISFPSLISQANSLLGKWSRKWRHFLYAYTWVPPRGHAFPLLLLPTTHAQGWDENLRNQNKTLLLLRDTLLWLYKAHRTQGRRQPSRRGRTPQSPGREIASNHNESYPFFREGFIKAL